MVHSELATSFPNLTIRQTERLRAWCTIFLDYEHQRYAAGVEFDYGDCSVGNILFTGCYLADGKNFNSAADQFSHLCDVRHCRVLNVTDGANLVLTALKDNGDFLANETSIVSLQTNDVPIRELFLLDDYLHPDQMRILDGLAPDQKREYLHDLARLPQPNPEALVAIAAADLIIYGPGTQHSSLFPSYLTRGLMEAIRDNTKAEKVFVANIRRDHDIPNQSVNHLLSAFHYYMSRHGLLQVDLKNLISTLFIQKHDQDNVNRELDADYVKPGDNFADVTSIQVRALDWETDRGRHYGGQLLDELMAIAQYLVDIKIKPYRHMVSIIVPMLDEERTIGKVVAQLLTLDLSRFGVAKEILVVDGGSRDHSVAVVKTMKSVRLFLLSPGQSGRGEALRLGLARARGDVILFFPADHEYSVSDIPSVVEPIINNQYKAVFGSRAIKCLNTAQHIRHIYGNNRLGYFLSRYGGYLLSLVSLILTNRYVTDPFTSCKCFDGALLKSLNLVSKGVNLEGEIIAKLGRHKEFILEVPVNYVPRTKKEGKKNGVVEGIKTLYAIFYHHFMTKS
ncbi:MAG: glycosyltransferase [Magnetococcales bacterium]|nr:glycosyltransferase [Magnetococcales bacterium]